MRHVGADPVAVASREYPRSEEKIIAIAGTFVVVSGLAYYAFMAAWLNVFAMIGMKPSGTDHSRLAGTLYRRGEC